MLHKLLGLEAILLVYQVQWVEPLIQGVVESIMQRPYPGENKSFEFQLSCLTKCETFPEFNRNPRDSQYLLTGF